MFRYLGGVYVLMILWVVYDIGEALQCQWWCWLWYNQLTLFEHIYDECYHQVSILVQWCVHVECRFLFRFIRAYTHSLIESTLWWGFLVEEYLFSLILRRGLRWKRWLILEGQWGTWILGLYLDFVLTFDTIIFFNIDAQVVLLWVVGDSNGGLQVQQELSILHHRHNQSIQEMLVQWKLFNVQFIVLLDDEEDGLLIIVFV